MILTPGALRCFLRALLRVGHFSKRHFATPARVRCFLENNHVLVGACPLLLFLCGIHCTVAWIMAGQIGWPAPAFQAWPSPRVVFLTYYVGMTILGFLSLLASNLWSTEAGVRRKPHLILRGTVVGVGPIMLLLTPMIVEGVKTPLC